MDVAMETPAITLEPEYFRTMLVDKDYDKLQQAGGVRILMSRLCTSLEGGIHPASIRSRRMQFGENTVPPHELQTFNEFMKEAASDKTMLILQGAAVVSLFLGLTSPDPRTGKVEYGTGWIEGAAILVSVFIVVLVTSINNFQKQKKFAELCNSAPGRSYSVVRAGVECIVCEDELVVGDIVRLGAGTSLTFDGLLIEGDGIVCDESNLTGEREEVLKTERDPFLVSGTHVVQGCEGVCVVVGVGVNSVSGVIAMCVRQKKKPTPLQEKLEVMADDIGKAGLWAAIITFVVLAIKETVTVWRAGQPFFAMKYLENLTTAVAIIVVAVPEGLPLSVTIALAYSMKQMMQDKNLVRHLAACETMGGATCIYSDKTGTLTTSDMGVTRIYIGGQMVDIQKTPQVTLPCVPPLTMRLLDAIFLNSPSQNNKTGEALVDVCRRIALASGYDVENSKRYLRKGEFRRYGFTSMKKSSSTTIRLESGTQLLTYVKGAGEVILEQCSHYCNEEGKRVPITTEVRQVLEKANFDMSSNGLRTLCIAYCERTCAASAELPTFPPEDPMTYVALVGIEEPLRPEVWHAVKVCQGAGIKVRMITGDNLATAMNIAKRCGIYADGLGMIAMEGKDFRKLSPSQLAEVLPDITVLARSTPLDKQNIVEAMMSLPNQVVAVTGDGTNDAPALKAADVGFAMNSGSDVAKNASDIILMDDNFVGVVKAVMWGRNVNDNIRKFLQFQLTVNIVACIVAFLGAVLNTQNLSPLKPVQLLWLNLIMDTLAALALATESPTDRLLEREPLTKNSPIISRRMMNNILGLALFQLVVELWLLVSGDTFFAVTSYSDEHLTIVFNAFVLMQVFNFFNARMLYTEANAFKDITKSPVLLCVVTCIGFMQIIIVQYGGRFMSTVPLNFSQWAWCTVLGSLSLPIGVVVRLAQNGHMRHGVSSTLNSKIISGLRLKE
jgi:calcium-translocating P-type ATPase